MHTHVVALAVMGSEYGSTAPVNSDDDEDDGGSGDEGVGTAKAEWKHNKSRFMAMVKQLLKILGAIKFPVTPLPHVSAAGKRGLLEEGRVFSCLEDVCLVCSRQYNVLRNVKVTALTPVSEVCCRFGLWSFRSLLRVTSALCRCRCYLLGRPNHFAVITPNISVKTIVVVLKCK